MGATIIRFGSRVKVGAAEQRALMRWFRDLKIVDMPKLANKHHGRYLVIDGDRA